MKNSVAFFMVSIAVLLTLLGCAGYYKITDPASNKVYYTQDINRKMNGAIRFKDEVSKTQVTLQQSEVIEITQDQFEAAAAAK
ncbi:MAG: hypothetical protein JW832_01860 [Deltaproteobacteria bacterium]|nr:hypothetical protein [Deltaproteobacteria bacterium]